MNRLYKKFIVLFSIVLTLPTSMHACWYGTEFEDVRFIILNPNLAQNKSWWSYFYTSKYHYMDGYVRGNQDEMIIAAEWKQKFNLHSTVKDIESYLFGSLPADSLKKNPFYKEMKSNKKLAAYFDYAKACEAVLYRADEWGDYNVDSMNVDMADLLIMGLETLKKQTDPFWKKKYAFQSLRLVYYLHDDKMFNHLYHTYFGFGNEKTPIDWWATHYKSMMLEGTDKDSANYLHALVFSHSSNKMFASRQWFSSKNFNGLTTLARNNQDLADLYVLKAMLNPGRALDEIKEIYKLNNSHPLITLLLIREMNKLEDWIGTHKYTNYYNNEWDEQPQHIILGQNIKDLANDYYYLRVFYKQIQSMQPTADTDLFYLIGANTALMNQDVAGAKKYLALVTSNDAQVVFQKQVLEIMLITITEDVKNPTTANKLGELLSYLVHRNDGQFESQKISFSVMKFLQYNLRAKGQNHLAGLVEYMAEEKFCASCRLVSMEYSIVDYFNRQNIAADVEKLIALFDKKDKTELDKFLLLPYPNAHYFKELLGTIYLRKGETQKARDMYAQLPTEFWDNFENMQNLDEDPFTANEQMREAQWKYFHNKFDITDKLYKLEVSSKNNPMDLITLGHAWYNFSGYGNSWFMLDYEWSNYPSRSSEKITQTALEISLRYYLSAYDKISRPEARAEIAFGIASIYKNSNNRTEKNYGYWADEFEKYNNTDFYRRANCSVTNELQDVEFRKLFFNNP